MMTVAGNLADRVPVGSAELAGGLLTAPHRGAIHGQTDEGAAVESLVTFGLAQGGGQGGAGGGGRQALGEVTQHIVTERGRDLQSPTRRGMHQGFHGVEGVFPEQSAEQQSPKQDPSRDLGCRAAIAGGQQIGLQTQTARQVFPEASRTRSLHRFFRRCFRAQTRSWALAASTSRTASWNSRPASTRRRTSSTQSLGMRSTRRFPFTMKVSTQAAWPFPVAQRQRG